MSNRVGNRVLLAAGVLLVAMNLRPGVVSVSPELSSIRSATGMSGALGGLLTTLPIVCFGVLAPLAPRLSRRIGTARALGAMMLLLTVGIAVRLIPGTVALFGGTVLVGAAIALSNVIVPGLIKRDFHDRTGLMMGLYSVALFCGAALAAGVTVPLGGALGFDWRAAIAMWAVFSLLALAVWAPQLRRGGAPAATAADATPARQPLRRLPLAWHITLLMGLQSLVYYSCTAWIPELLTSDGMDSGTAGWMLSLMSLVGIAGSVVFTVVVGRFRNQMLFGVVGSALFAASLAGLLVAPVGGAYLWMILQGLGSGLLISTSLAVIVLRSPDGARAAEMSGMAQGVGYLLAAVGPLALGAVHDATGGWTLPLLILLVLTAPMAVFGVLAGRNRVLGDAEPSRSEVAASGGGRPGAGTGPDDDGAGRAEALAAAADGPGDGESGGGPDRSARP